MKPRFIYLDIDGVIANFHAEAIRAHIRKGPLKTRYGTHTDPLEAYELASNERWPRGYSLQKYMGIEDIDAFWHPINNDPLFWRGIQPYPWYRKLIEVVSGYCDHLVLCTSPSNHHYSWGGKALWLALHKLDHIPCVMMGINDRKNEKPSPVGKWMMAAPDRLLIDDYHKNTDPFIEEGGKAILFPQPWNRAHEYCDDPVGYTVAQLERLTEG
jgi:hypothetical protein